MHTVQDFHQPLMRGLFWMLEAPAHGGLNCLIFLTNSFLLMNLTGRSLHVSEDKFCALENRDGLTCLIFIIKPSAISLFPRSKRNLAGDEFEYTSSAIDNIHRGDYERWTGRVPSPTRFIEYLCDPFPGWPNT